MSKYTAPRTNRLLLPLLFGVLLLWCGRSLASDIEAESLPDAQIFTCDASQGTSYQLSIVTTERGSLEAIVALQAVGTEATLVTPQGLRLYWSPVETGFSFSGQGFELVGLANVAVLHDGAQAVACHLQTREKHTDVAIPTPGLSLGGRVRSGPGLDFVTRTILAAKTPMTLLENTELSMDGYDWFRFETQAGVTGYQWGGVICSREGVLQGVLRKCE